MKNEAVARIIEYHETTKHHYERFAKSLGYMDWANQPEPFRTFKDAPAVHLPLLEKDPDAAHADLYSRKNNAERPFTAKSIAGFLELSMGLSAWKSIPGSRWALRINPSSGNLHPTEAYLALPGAEGIESGIYHYNPLLHALEQRAKTPSDLWGKIQGYFGCPGFLAGLTSIYWREAWKYGERAFRYCNHDAGHALACLSIAANLFGWKVLYLNGLSDRDVENMLGCDRTVCEKNEKEHPDLMCYVFPSSENTKKRDIAPEIIEEFARLEFSGVPNRLSGEYHSWKAIDRAGETTKKPRTAPEVFSAGDGLSPTPAPADSELSAPAIIRRRRSAQGFDGSGAIAEENFFSMLARTVPEKGAAPFDAELSPARLHLLIFAHNISGLNPGLYFFARNPDDLESIRPLCRPEFLWRPVREGFPLYLLREGNYRAEAAKVSCYQDIAGDSAFSLGMIARFKDWLERGAHNYKGLFWESGMIGQVLYLEAEAHGLRGTGIGCYFDDAVHQLLGLSDNTFQSLYHFTVGKPILDRRLKTLPPYYHLEYARGS